MYLETRIVDYGGVVDPRHMRTGAKHPTRLANGEEVAGHDDEDCIEDFIAAELIVDGQPYRLTPTGWRLAGSLRRWRSEGHQLQSYHVDRPSHHAEETFNEVEIRLGGCQADIVIGGHVKSFNAQELVAHIANLELLAPILLDRVPKESKPAPARGSGRTRSQSERSGRTRR